MCIYSTVQPVIVTRLESITLPQGKSHTFVCAAVADTRIVLAFRFNEERITSNSSKHNLVTDSTHGTLTIVNLQGSDEGIYTCSASNKYGSVSTAAMLSVQGRLVFGVQVATCVILLWEALSLISFSVVISSMLINTPHYSYILA